MAKPMPIHPRMETQRTDSSDVNLLVTLAP